MTSLTITCWYLVLTLAVPFCTSDPAWQSQSYFGNLIAENNVGGVIFDPLTTSQCFGTAGTVVISLISCPFNANYFSVTSNKIVLGASYPLANNANSAVIPDCLIGCTDSTNVTKTTALTIQLVGANTKAPVWSNSFPTVINLTSLEPLQYLMNTPATDADYDKTSDGWVTYNVTSMDGAAQLAQYFIYEMGGNSSRLNLYNTPPWSPGSQHTIVISAKDNPRNGTPNVISKTITITVLADAITVTGATFATTTPSTSTSTTSVTTTGALSTTLAAQVQSSTVNATSSTCSGASLSCNNNWIWLVVGLGLAMVLAGGGLALGMYLRDKNKKSEVSPSQQMQRQQPRQPSQPQQQRQYNMWPAGQQQHPNYVNTGAR